MPPPPPPPLPNLRPPTPIPDKTHASSHSRGVFSAVVLWNYIDAPPPPPPPYKTDTVTRGVYSPLWYYGTISMSPPTHPPIKHSHSRGVFSAVVLRNYIDAPLPPPPPPYPDKTQSLVGCILRYSTVVHSSLSLSLSLPLLPPIKYTHRVTCGRILCNNTAEFIRYLLPPPPPLLFVVVVATNNLVLQAQGWG